VIGCAAYRRFARVSQSNLPALQYFATKHRLCASIRQVAAVSCARTPQYVQQEEQRHANLGNDETQLIEPREKATNMAATDAQRTDRCCASRASAVAVLEGSATIVKTLERVLAEASLERVGSCASE
jgi:hypothetical protein